MGRRLAPVLMLAFTFLWISPGTTGLAAGKSGQFVDLAFNLPDGSEPKVVLSVLGDRISLEFPGGTVVPVEVLTEAKGLIASHELTKLSEERIRLELVLDGGRIADVVFQPTGFLVRLGGMPAGPGNSNFSIAEYRLGPTDKILIAVGGQAELTQTLVVKTNGKISVQLLGEVQAAGLTVQELGERVADLLARDYLVDPQVDVQVLEYNSQWVLVTGEVRNPGRYPLRGSTALKEVLAQAGGLTREAGSEILITRGEGSPAGRTDIRLDRHEFEAGRLHQSLAHGDLINIVRATYCYIQGEVRNPGRIQVEPGMTLLKAITLAGGLSEWADRKAVRVLLENSEEPAKTYNLKKIQSQRNPDPELQGGEIIIVNRRFL